MKTRLTSLLTATLALGCLNAPNVRARLEVSADIHITATSEFHAPLAAHGTWITVGTYGRCWRPAGVSVSWRPYTFGRWVWTDCGWYWESDEPWAWACYHYGNWIFDPQFGWVWVPGVEWSPAWVSWRIGGGYCGWAPLPPRGVVLKPRFYAFVKLGHFHDPIRPASVIVNNVTIINKTRVHGGPHKENRNFGSAGKQTVVINSGPTLTTVEKAAGKKFKPQSIREVSAHASVPHGVGHNSHAAPEGPAERHGEHVDHQAPGQIHKERKDTGHGQPDHGSPRPDNGPSFDHGHDKGKQSPKHGKHHGGQ